MKQTVYSMILALAVTAVFTSVSQGANYVPQKGLLGFLGIEIPAMKSARHQMYHALKARQEAQEEKRKAEAAFIESENVFNDVRLERSIVEKGLEEIAKGKAELELLTLAFEKAKAEAENAQAALAVKEAEVAAQIELARQTKESADKSIAEAQNAKAEAEKAKAEAENAVAAAKKAEEDAKKQKDESDKAKAEAENAITAARQAEEEAQKMKNEAEKAQNEIPEQENKAPEAN